MGFKRITLAALAFVLVVNSFFANLVGLVDERIAIVLVAFSILLSAGGLLRLRRGRNRSLGTILTVFLILLFGNGLLVLSLLTNFIGIEIDKIYNLQIALTGIFVLSAATAALTYVNDIESEHDQKKTSRDLKL